MITSIDPASLKISWQPPEEISHTVSITGYVIQYIRDGLQNTTSDIENIVNVPCRTTHTISRLVAYAKYSVKIAAISVDRTGPFSEPVIGISGEDSE